MPINKVALHARENLDVIRGDASTVALKNMLAGRDFREMTIATALDSYWKSYDLVVMDCAPSVDVCTRRRWWRLTTCWCRPSR